MKIKDLIQNKTLTTSIISKVKTYSEEVDIPMKELEGLLGTSNIMFKKLLGFYNLKKIVNLFDSMHIVMLYTSIGETSEIIMLSGKYGGLKYVITGVVSVDRKSEGKRDLTGRMVHALKNNMLDRDISHFGMYDFQIAFPSKYIDTSSDLLNAISNTKVEDFAKKTDREYKLGLIVQTAAGLNLNVQNIEYESTLDNLDLLYENIDDEYLETLLEAIHTKKKGNIIFSGLPGTGKTYFIRKIIKDYYDKYEALEDESDLDEDDIVSRIFDRKKNVADKLFLYVPVNLAHVFSNPEFVSLLQNTAAEYPKGIVIILEDAEKVLESREATGSNYAVTELLEMSDGMLNDIVNTQFIFTYNTDTDNIDKALLRAGRLLALKEFKQLSPERANRLAEELSINKTYSEEITLAEVFKELAVEEETILIDKEDNKVKIGF